MDARVYSIVPVPKPRMTRRDKWARRPCVMRYRRFADQVRWKIARDGIPEGARITFWLPMPESWPEARKAQMAGQPHRQKPDIDNLIKALLDALHKDDSHVASLTVEKRWARRGCIEVEALAR